MSSAEKSEKIFAPRHFFCLRSLNRAFRGLSFNLENRPNFEIEKVASEGAACGALIKEVWREVLIL